MYAFVPKVSPDNRTYISFAFLAVIDVFGRRLLHARCPRGERMAYVFVIEIVRVSLR